LKLQLVKAFAGSPAHLPPTGASSIHFAGLISWSSSALWLYRLEHDDEPATEEEMVMYNKFRELLDDDHVEIYGSKLSSTVARLWGSMLDEVVVWG
jgi:hypothetical protein